MADQRAVEHPARPTSEDSPASAGVSPKWAESFTALAELIASWSKDRSTQVGAVIVGPDLEIRSTGYNGFPRGVCDDVDERHGRPQKYLWTEHAERNAIYNAARFGVSLKGCMMFATCRPCARCARAIVQVGITTIFFRSNSTWKGATEQENEVAQTILREGNVQIFEVPSGGPK